MGQSLVKNYMHIVFSTKQREELIHPPYKEKIHAYLGGICKQQNCQPLIIGGYKDHIHILCRLSQNIKLAKLIEQVKSHSSRWIKTLDPSLSNFYWQDGYGAFSVNPHEIDVVVQYIKNQDQHHRTKDFKNEYKAFLDKHKMDHDERYVWD
ncbi:REP element-mobilizing transposase RayT [Ancylomarina subtilis]|uniref:REP element-mobilizing transposase RayT n=1 Tax=Ancylomarina subtilis TaxID=1639035 RepID=A0A4Q7VJQ3_9BACT|nr:IS200/IS605 family transposase [Ancylomarina subtilis]RZT96334.1 REP element-mobilizing transposase RayT [Ancylomarina subtilis]